VTLPSSFVEASWGPRSRSHRTSGVRGPLSEGHGRWTGIRATQGPWPRGTPPPLNFNYSRRESSSPTSSEAAAPESTSLACSPPPRPAPTACRSAMRPQGTVRRVGPGHRRTQELTRPRAPCLRRGFGHEDALAPGDADVDHAHPLADRQPPRLSAGVGYLCCFGTPSAVGPRSCPGAAAKAH